MNVSQAFQSIPADLAGAFSLVVVTLAGLVAVLWDSLDNDAKGIPWLAVVALGVALVWEFVQLGTASTLVFSGMVRAGGFAAFVNLIVLLSALLTTLLAVPYLRSIRHHYGEVYALLLFATAGMMLLGTANNLVPVFVGLETMSISLYILSGLVREEGGGVEAALKYFLLGAFSTGFFLYGIALLYGATGTMYLHELAPKLAVTGRVGLFWAGVGLLLVGFLFKVSAVPFHMWTPDVYQGAPTPLTGFMSTASKASAFASLILVLYHALPAERWSLVLAVVAVLTMVLGNIIALAQTNVKRMLAYSSIAHAGYVLVGLAAGSAQGYAGALVYLLIYSLMNIGAFGVLALLEWDDREGSAQTLDSLAGVGLRKPLLGVTMGIFMFSLSGFPPMAGFFGKVAVFAPAIDAGLTWLVLIGVVASAISAGYYLRILWVMWMRTPEEVPAASEARAAAFPVPGLSAAVLVTCAALLLVLGFVPDLYEITASYFRTAAPVAVSIP